MTAKSKRCLKNIPSFATATVAIVAAVLWVTPQPAAADSVAVPPANTRLNMPAAATRTTVLAGGCFWGMEMVFQHVEGVAEVVAGYAGGDAKTHANYGDVSTGRYGFAEAVRITYNPNKVSYTDLLRIYFSVAHDPTQSNRQGPDAGLQYRSEIFARNAEQARVARAYIHQLTQADVFDGKIVTEVSTGEKFFPAEDYHQNYGLKHPNSLYIRMYDAPKVVALREHFQKLYRKQSVALANNRQLDARTGS